MNTITLHPINHGFDNDNGTPMETWNLVYPSHLKSVLFSEYRFLRKEGVSRRVARWHVHRMLNMLQDGIPWVAELVQEDDWYIDEEAV